MATRRKRTRSRSEGDHVAQLYARIYAVVRTIPRGQVATYGQVAELAGIPGGARVAGAAMRASTPEMGLPWHRVIGKRARATGKINILDPVGAAIQRSMLEDEGVELTDAGSIRLSEYGWLPLDEKPRKGRGRKKGRRAKARRP